ncbi:MAG TPA: hypothetical protein PKL58_05575, partial [Methylophilaceae bacterium]|nr:hypothetical protein [Methylophilaceae bacterium]
TAADAGDAAKNSDIDTNAVVKRAFAFMITTFFHLINLNTKYAYLINRLIQHTSSIYACA